MKSLGLINSHGIAEWNRGVPGLTHLYSSKTEQCEETMVDMAMVHFLLFIDYQEPWFL